MVAWLVALCGSLTGSLGPRARRIAAVLALVLLPAMLAAAPARAEIVARVDLATQRMTVTVDGSVQAVWSVSTARRGYFTPRGTYRPQALARMHYSKKYHNSPMPYSVFFRGGFAVHGTYALAQLGRPASHGCVRLAPQNAQTLYNLIQSHGAGSTRIVIS